MTKGQIKSTMLRYIQDGAAAKSDAELLDITEKYYKELFPEQNITSSELIDSVADSYAETVLEQNRDVENLDWDHYKYGYIDAINYHVAEAVKYGIQWQKNHIWKQMITNEPKDGRHIVVISAKRDLWGAVKINRGIYRKPCNIEIGHERFLLNKNDLWCYVEEMLPDVLPTVSE